MRVPSSRLQTSHRLHISMGSPNLMAKSWLWDLLKGQLGQGQSDLREMTQKASAMAQKGSWVLKLFIRWDLLHAPSVGFDGMGGCNQEVVLSGPMPLSAIIADQKPYKNLRVMSPNNIYRSKFRTILFNVWKYLKTTSISYITIIKMLLRKVSHLFRLCFRYNQEMEL